MLRVFAVLAAVGCLGCAAKAPTSPDENPDGGTDAGVAAPDDLSALLETERAKGKLPALSGAAFRGDVLLGIGAAGVRKQGDPTPVTVDDKWHLGSDTKAMTGVLVGLSVDRGQVHFEDKLPALFPGETVDPGYADVTLEQLLQHRGGFPANIEAGIWSAMYANGSQPDARIKAVRAMLALPPAQAPGAFVYSNAGYIIAGAALERVTGKTWEQLMQDDLFTPLQMEGCGFGPPGSETPVTQPWGHRHDRGTLVPLPPGPGADNPASLGPAGTVHCPLRAWSKFLAINLAGARGEATLLSVATMRRLHTAPSGGDFAAGWVVGTRPWAKGLTLNHTGSNTYWLVTAWLAPARNLSLVLVTNAGNAAASATVDAAFAPLIARYAK